MENISNECPITREKFVDPVIADDGFVYEREAITEWIKEQSKIQRSDQLGLVQSPKTLQLMGMNLKSCHMIHSFFGLKWDQGRKIQIGPKSVSPQVVLADVFDLTSIIANNEELFRDCRLQEFVDAANNNDMDALCDMITEEYHHGNSSAALIFGARYGVLHKITPVRTPAPDPTPYLAMCCAIQGNHVGTLCRLLERTWVSRLELTQLRDRILTVGNVKLLMALQPYIDDRELAHCSTLESARRGDIEIYQHLIKVNQFSSEQVMEEYYDDALIAAEYKHYNLVYYLVCHGVKPNERFLTLCANSEGEHICVALYKKYKQDIGMVSSAFIEHVINEQCLDALQAVVETTEQFEVAITTLLGRLPFHFRDDSTEWILKLLRLAKHRNLVISVCNENLIKEAVYEANEHLLQFLIEEPVDRQAVKTKQLREAYETAIDLGHVNMAEMLKMHI